MPMPKRYKRKPREFVEATVVRKCGHTDTNQFVIADNIEERIARWKEMDCKCNECDAQDYIARRTAEEEDKRVRESKMKKKAQDDQVAWCIDYLTSLGYTVRISKE